MSEANHGPLPWVYEPDLRTVFAANGENGYPSTVCDILDVTEGLEGDCPQADANAEFIVLAANSHDELVAVCGKVLDLADRFPVTIDYDHWQELINAARAAQPKG